MLKHTVPPKTDCSGFHPKHHVHGCFDIILITFSTVWIIFLLHIIILRARPPGGRYIVPEYLGAVGILGAFVTGVSESANAAVISS